MSRATVAVDADEVRAVFALAIAELEAELPDLIADSYQASDRKLSLPTVMKRARTYLKAELENGERAQDLISGKAAISRISAEVQRRWNVQISPMALCRHLELANIPAELRDAVSRLA
jgi:hypothetical protein